MAIPPTIKTMPARAPSCFKDLEVEASVPFWPLINPIAKGKTPEKYTARTKATTNKTPITIVRLFFFDILFVLSFD